MIVEKTHIPRTLIIFIDVESLRTGARVRKHLWRVL